MAMVKETNMKAAILDSQNVVANIAKVADEAFAQSQGWVVSDTARIGDTYSDGQFIRPEPTPEPNPQSVTRRQAKQELAIRGLLQNVQPAIDAIPDALEQTLVQIYWDDATDFERDNPALMQLGGALGLTSKQIDDLFIEAAKR